MSAEKYRTTPWPSKSMPPGVPYIISNEVAERFSFYGMKTILTVFMVKYLWLMDDQPGIPMSDAAASERYHLFSAWVYFTPLFGALLADVFFGKYRIIIWLSIVYCLGHGALAVMGYLGSAHMWLIVGLWLITIGSGGVKPCVSAHVGDQFGSENQHLLTKIFNWFYFSINLGAFISSLMTPWLLEWYGPHLAFGVPGALMAIATVCFWAGRHKFIHVPAQGAGVFKELFSRDGIFAVLKLCIIYLFVLMFWALFDQTGSSWVLQAEDMNRDFLGINWLPSQIQALNPILILCFIPLFTYLVYPAINRFFPLSPLRKISIGLFLTAVAFAIIALAQQRIDAGETPSISWQLLAYFILTAAEVMVSIVCLEFSYTQAPRSLKSIVMALFFFSIWLGNFFTAGVNRAIQIDNPVAVDWNKQETNVVQIKSPEERDIIVHKENGLSFHGKTELDEIAETLKTAIAENDYRVLSQESGDALLTELKDPWGNAYRYSTINRLQCRVWSAGTDKQEMTAWDQGFIAKITLPETEKPPGKFSKLLSLLRPERTWLEVRKEKLGVADEQGGADNAASVSVSHFIGGQTKLEGAPYFWFFTKLMLGAAVAFVFVAIWYKPRAYLYEDSENASG